MSHKFPDRTEKSGSLHHRDYLNPWDWVPSSKEWVYMVGRDPRIEHWGTPKFRDKKDMEASKGDTEREAVKEQGNRGSVRSWKLSEECAPKRRKWLLCQMPLIKPVSHASRADTGFCPGEVTGDRQCSFGAVSRVMIFNGHLGEVSPLTGA